MTQDEIIRMAREAGIEEWEIGVEGNRSSTQSRHLAKYERFAALVAAHEREACAKVCDERSEEMKHRADGEMLTNLGKTVALEKAKTLDMCATAIRARGD